MPIPEPVVRLLAGSGAASPLMLCVFSLTDSAAGAADRTHERRTRRQYASSDENLKQMTEVTREVVACRTSGYRLQSACD